MKIYISTSYKPVYSPGMQVDWERRREYIDSDDPEYGGRTGAEIIKKNGWPTDGWSVNGRSKDLDEPFVDGVMYIMFRSCKITGV